MIQNLMDGILTGSIISLGAIGLTMVMHMLRFANFAYAELLAIGAYAALVFDRLFAALVPVMDQAFGGLSLTWSLTLATLAAMAITGLSAVLIDWAIFKRIRQKADALSMVFASFGVALIIRNVITLIFGLKAELYSNDIAFAMVLSRDPLLLIKPDQVFVLVAALVLMTIFHLVLSRTTFGFALRAVAENPALAQVAGVPLARIIIVVWMIGGAFSAAAGVFYALTNHLSPLIGHNFLLPVFAATIVGGIGSVYGALLGGFIVGIASGLALQVLPSGYSPAMPFLIILAVLLVRPQGLFGEAEQT
ncbi:branched-chain amino acid ABC transporter permease [Sulfitobacter aestuariivivens]|uniref:Branched-chain amino acid ABC transporter permease n=1 Tax=Sulfitobacter aestuariivivens TaxID=2766981 RepID=A0A927HDU4_9RHOB|nr:branched-chain amino acid ABC transporter permease [Sulfitobacter aestuariivivens]MBD3664087.1 branched-chain amino acid ABC transporter permease [Sulfitobacter aestuariivivens]